MTTDVGAVKFVVSQVWRAFEPRTFIESNGLSSMSYGLPAAMAAKLLFPERPVVCTIGDGGLGMTMAELETCVRHRLNVITVVFNDEGLNLIRAVQQTPVARGRCYRRWTSQPSRAPPAGGVEERTTPSPTQSWRTGR